MPTQHGPANPLRVRPTGYRAAMMFSLTTVTNVVRPPCTRKVQKQFAKMSLLWKDGLDTFKRALPGVPSHKRRLAELDLAIAETCYYHFQSAGNQVEFYMLRRKTGDKAALARMRAIAEEEMQVARRQFPIARDQSVIAYEASNHYYYTPWTSWKKS